MRHARLSLGLVGLLLLTALAGDPPAGGTDSSAGCSDTLRVPLAQLPVDSSFRVVENNAFGIGEKLTFTLGWQMVKAGEAILEVGDIFDHNSRKVYRVKSTARTFPFFDTFFKVRDTAETWIDVDGVFTWHFRKQLREGKYKDEQVQEFDQYRNVVRYRDTLYAVSREIQDVLSALFYVRTQDLQVGQSVFVNNFANNKCYPLEVIIRGRETVKVPAGRFNCLKIEPLLKAAGIFKNEGKVTVWVTDDRLKMPVLMKSKVIVGAIYAELKEYQLGELYEGE